MALVERIVVTSLEPGPRRCRSIEERGRIESALASWAFAEQGREPADGRSLLPLYRIDLQLADGAARVCWLGTNSHPPRFPCYGLRSGWWLAPSTGGGVLDPSRYRGLPESVYFELLDGLDILSVDDLPEVPAEAACPPAPTAP